MKRKLALIMAGAMVGTMVPAIPAHAATDNRVDKVVSVNSDDEFGTEGGVERTDYSTLKIKNDKKDITTASTFRVVLGAGAKWAKKGAGYEVDGTETVGTTTITREAINDTVLEVRTNAGLSLDTDTISVPMYVKLDGASGQLKATVDARDAAVTAGEYTYAVVADGDTTATAGSKEVIVRGEDQKIANITIDETTIGKMKAGSFKVKLPADFEWDTTGTAGTNATKVVGTGDVTATIASAQPDARELVIDVTRGSSSKRSSILITGFVKATRDAKFGDVDVSISDIKGTNIASKSGLVVAEYKDYGVSVKADKVIDVVAGKEDSAAYKVKLILEESAKATLMKGRDIEFTMDKGVAAVPAGESVTITKKSGTTVLATTATDNSMKEGKAKNESNSAGDEWKDQTSQFDINVTDVSTDKAKYEIEFPVLVSADYSGDVKIKIKGAGITEQEVVIAKAKPMVTMEVKKGDNAKLADVKVGVQGQDAPEMVLTEAASGALRKGEFRIKFDKDFYGVSFDDVKFEVVEGDIQIDQSASGTANGKKEIKLVIKSDSRKASKIKISGIKVSLDRTAPEGTLKTKLVGVNSITSNKVTKDTTVEAGLYKDMSGNVAKFDYVNVVTPAPGAVKSTTTFALDSTKYTVLKDGVKEEKEMDVAPFVSNGRAMLPVRYVSEALNSQVVWDDATRTATIFKGDRVVQFVLDQNYYTVNGVKVFMDTKPVVKNGRALLPIRYVADALGVVLEWNDADKTITVQY